MPLRLLGLTPDLESLDELGGRALARYAERGVAVTVACASGEERGPVSHRARRLGIQGLFLLDYRPAERESDGLSALFADIIRAIQPQVVVVFAWDEAVQIAGSRAFTAAREAAGGSGALPAKLYHRFAVGAGPGMISTAVPVGSGRAAVSELFQRVFPTPWVTGVLEHDLFAGLSGTGEPTGVWRDERLAS